MVKKKLLILFLICLFSFSDMFNAFALSDDDINSEDFALQLEIIPDKGMMDPSCKIPKITFTNLNQLTKKITLDCIPKEATQVEVLLKRNPNWLRMIEKRFVGTSLEGKDLVHDPAAIIADRMIVEIEREEEKEPKVFFDQNSNETDLIKLPFVNNGTAIVPDDLTLGITGVSFPFDDTLTLKDFKQLLKDLKLLSADNNNGYDLETQEATYELLYIIDQLRCALVDETATGSNLKAQIAQGTLQCEISSSNYQEYILSSIKANLPYVVSLIGVSNSLRTFGTNSPQISVQGLSSSILLNALADATTIGKLLPWQIGAVGFFGLLLYYTLSNAQLKADTNNSTCTRAFGIVDRRFFIGKDLNNNDIKRTNTMVSVSATNNLFNTNLNVIEPFPHVPLQPGIFSGCLQDGEYTFTLLFNNQSTFSMTGLVQRPFLSFLPKHTTDFWGGVFRKYGTVTAIPKIIESKTIFSSLEGDLKSFLNPIGSGAYVTNLSLIPNVNASNVEIANALRIYKQGTFETGNPDSKGELEPEKANAFVDLAINTKTITLYHNSSFSLQFVLPNLPITFGYPEEPKDFILIDRFGIP